MARFTTFAVIAVLSLTIFAHVVDGSTNDAVQVCVQDYVDAVFEITDKNKICPILTRYLDCLFDAVNAEGFSEAQIAELERNIKDLMDQNSIDCQIDIRALIDDKTTANQHDDELDLGDGTDTTSDNNTDAIRMCVKNYIDAVFKTTDMNQICPILTRYMNCLLDAIDKQVFTENEIFEFETQMKALMEQTGIDCYIDIRALLENRRSGNWAGRVVSNLSVVQTLLLALLLAIGLRAT